MSSVRNIPEIPLRETPKPLREGESPSDRLASVGLELRDKPLEGYDSTVSKVSIPETPEGYGYVPELGAYISPSEIPGMTGTIRTPTPSERIKIEEAQRKGSAEYISKQARKKITEPVLEYIEPVTSKIRDIPIYSPLGKELSPIDKYTSKYLGETIGERVLTIREGLDKTGEITKTGWLDISERLGEKSKDYEEGSFKGTGLEFFSDVSGVTAKVGGVAPRTIPYLLSGSLAAGGDILASEQRLKESKKEVDKRLRESYKLYKEDYEKQKKELPEDYEMESKLSKEEFGKEYRSEIQGQVEKEIRTEQTIPLLILGTTGAVKLGKATKTAFTPKIDSLSIKGGKTINLKTPQQTKFINTPSGVKEVGFFKDMSIRTPVTGLKQSPFSRFIGREPKLSVIQRGQTYIGQPVSNIYNIPIRADQPYLYQFGRVGRKGDIVNRKFYQVYPDKSTQISKESLIGLQKPEQYLFKSVVEKTKTGIPIRMQDTGKYIPEETILQRGGITSVDISKIGTGKSITPYRTGSLVTPKGKVDGFEIFATGTGIKKYSPFWRASGKPSVTERIIIRAPTTPQETTGTWILGTKKSPSSYLEQLYQTPKVIPKPKVNIPKAKTTITPPQESITVTSEIPTASVWAGTGLYERTQSVSAISPERATPIISPSFITTTPKDTIRVMDTPRVDTTQRVIQDTRQIPKGDFKLLGLERTKELTSTKAIQDVKPAERTIQRTFQKPVEKAITLQKTVQKPIQKTETSLTEPPKKPTETSRIFKPLKSKKLIDEESEDKEDKLFEVFTRKKGKDIGIGEFKTLRKARRALKGELKESLRASGFIERAGKKVAPELGKFGRGFRVGKKEPFRVVQRKTRRLGSPSETKEIQFFRKKRGGVLK